MFCPKCGSQCGDNSAFCSNCGMTFNDTNSQSNQNGQVNQPNQLPTYPTQQYQQPTPPPYGQQPIPPQYQQPYQPQPIVPGKGMSIASLVLGIVAIVFCCAFYISIPCGVAGLILGIIGNNKSKQFGIKNGIAVAGIVCSAIGLALCVVFWLFVIIGSLDSWDIYGDYYGYPSA